MYYRNGNYEAFARPRKPKGMEKQTAWFVGLGLAALAGAAFLIRDTENSNNGDQSRKCTNAVRFNSTAVVDGNMIEGRIGYGKTVCAVNITAQGNF